MTHRTADIKRTSRDPAPHDTIVVAAQVATPTTRNTDWPPANRGAMYVQHKGSVEEDHQSSKQRPKGRNIGETTSLPDPRESRLSPEELDPKVDEAHEHDDAPKEDSDAHGRRRRRPASAGKVFACNNTTHHLHAAGQGRQALPLARTPLTQRPRHHHAGPPLSPSPATADKP